MPVDAWWSWQWLGKPGRRKPPIGLWARSGVRYVRWRAAAIVIIGNLFHILNGGTLDTCTKARDYIIILRGTSGFCDSCAY